MIIDFTLNSAKTKVAFRPLFSTIQNSNVLPSLDCILVENNGVLSFTASDLENTVRIERSTAGKEQFKFLLNGQKVKKVLQNNIFEDVVITGNEKKVKIKNGDFCLTSSSLPVDQYPVPVKLDKSSTLSVSVAAKDLLPYIENALLFVSRDDLRPAMTGINLVDWKGCLHLVSTDAHRLYWHSLMETPEQFKGTNVIIPEKCARLICRSFVGHESVKISLDARNGYIEFFSNDTTVVSKLIDARFPKFEVVIPPCGSLSIYLKRSQIVAFLKIALPFTDRSTNKLILVVSVNSISVSGGDINLEDEFQYSLPVYNATEPFAPFSFGVNATFLLKVLSVTKDEYVKINHSTMPTKPILVDDCALIMPLMIPD